ncbi:MAG TPA: TIGR03118 family protein [Candidatus Sulfotelmatobacter sp.]|nr:TIGR03118 family protein [Candidatus Sulfotelmatobacter sp.]
MKLKLLTFTALVALGLSSIAEAQQTGYSQTNLVANTAGIANHTDPLLSNPWGISFIPGQPFWVANNDGGTSTIYDALGNTVQPAVTIPGAGTNPCNPGCPTGTVANTQTGFFGDAAFLFDTEDGIIAKWTGQGNATTVIDNSSHGAVYKGLATVTNNEGTFLLAANFNSGAIDVFDRNFNAGHLAGTLTDPNLPAGFAPHGVHVINGLILVAYAKQDTAKHDPVLGAGLGVVDAFDMEGNFRRTFASGGTLNAPWGVAATPAAYGMFSNDILIGNFGDGTMSAYDTQGNFLAQVTDSAGHVITNPGLWDMVFGAGGTGDPNTLYFTAGGANQNTGLFATLVPATAANGPNFSLNLSAPSLTVAAGGSGTLTVSSAAVGGFNGQITLTCTAGSGLTCSFSPGTISPGSSAATSTLTVGASATPPGGWRIRWPRGAGGVSRNGSPWNSVYAQAAGQQGTGRSADDRVGTDCGQRRIHRWLRQQFQPSDTGESSGAHGHRHVWRDQPHGSRERKHPLIGVAIAEVMGHILDVPLFLWLAPNSSHSGKMFRKNPPPSLNVAPPPCYTTIGFSL